MAAILRASAIQTVRRAFSGEGTLSVRSLHNGHNNPTAYASCAKQNLKPGEVDPSFKKIDDTARKELVIGYTERLVRQLKSSNLLDSAVYCLVSMSAAGTFILGYQVGQNQSLAEKRQASSGKKARRP